MRRIVVVFLVITAVSMASSVEQLKKLLGAPQATAVDDNWLAHRVSEFRLKERLSASELAEIRAMRLGSRTAAMIELLADYSEFEPGSAEVGAPLSPQEAAELLKKTQTVAANYVRNLPDFICTTTIRRFLSYPMSAPEENEYLKNLRLQDTISNEVSFENGRESYRAKTVNGQPTDKAVLGMTTMGEFGSILGSILIEGASVTWNRWESIDGKRLAVFRYSVDAAHSGYIVKWADDKHAPKQVKPPFNGEISVDPATGSIAHLTRHAVLPRQAPMNSIDTVVEYRLVLIAGSAYICPVKSVTRSAWKAKGGGFEFSLNEARFGSYHKFEGESKLGFDEPVVAPPQTIAAPAVAPLPGEPVSERIQIEPIASPAVAPTVRELPPAPSGITLRSTTRLVDVSAIVVDRKGMPVTDLKKEDFQIFDEGKLRSVRLFSAPGERVGESPAPDSRGSQVQSQTNSGEASPRVFSNRAGNGAGTSAPIIILIDEGLPVDPLRFGKFDEISFGRDRLIKFLRQAPPGQQIGLYKPIEHGVGIVHEFTKDSADLLKIVQEWGFGPPPYTLQSSQMVDHRGNNWQSSPSARLPPEPGSSSGKRGHASDDSQHGLELHPCGAEFALEAITATANHVAGIPGRKTLIWYTQTNGLGGDGGMQNCFYQEQTAQRALNKANVALYAIDARGLQSVQPDAAFGMNDVPGCTFGCTSGLLVEAEARRRPQIEILQIDQSHAVMLEMADKSGGVASFTNDILGELRIPFDESHGMYALGFYPETSKSDGSYHVLEVKVPGRPDLRVRYRRGYVDESSDPKEQLRTALWSPLDSSAIALSAELVGTEVKVSIGVAGLDLEQRDGRWQGRIHVVVAQRDQEGKQYDYRDDALRLDLKAETYSGMLKSGLVYRQELKPNAKAVSLLVVVTDEAGNLGSVTVPMGIPQARLIPR